MGWRDSTRWLLGRHLRALILLTNTGCLPCDRHGAGLWEHSSGQSHTCSCRFCRWWDSQTQSDNLSFMMYSRTFFSSQFYKREDWDSGHTASEEHFLVFFESGGLFQGGEVSWWVGTAGFWDSRWPPHHPEQSRMRKTEEQGGRGTVSISPRNPPISVLCGSAVTSGPQEYLQTWGALELRAWKELGRRGNTTGLSSGEVLFYLILISGGSSAFRIQPPAPRLTASQLVQSLSKTD